MVQVSVVIPTMKGREAMLQKLLSTIPDNYEKIVVDDDDLLLAAKRNKGARKAQGEYILFIDDDNYLEPGAIWEMTQHFSKEIGVMGMVACYDDKKMRVADGGSYRSYLTGFTQGAFTNARVYEIGESLYEVDEVANAFMVRREVFLEVGGLDSFNFPIDLDEADLCRRLKDMGYLIMMNPRALCYHKSITYSHIPDFRRPINAYCMARHRIYFQRSCNSHIRYGLYLVFFLPVFVGFYTLSLFYRKKPSLIPHFLKGVYDGLRNSPSHPYRAG